MAEDNVDYLEVDEPIAGQNYVCLSFVSPESLVMKKKRLKYVNFYKVIVRIKN